MNNNQPAESHTATYHVRERKKSNLAFAFFCLDKERAQDMEIFYAFCRLMDDIADEEDKPLECRRKELESWKNQIELAYAENTGAESLSPLGMEMRQMCRRRKIPQTYIQDIIDGVMRDTDSREFETFDDVKKYCYGVASAVGLASIYIFGFKNERSKEFAENLGYALQFTNMLRDVVDDAKNHGRIYVPNRELRTLGISRADLSEPGANPACKRLFKLMYFRAKHFFNKARRLLPPEDKRAFAPALIMWAIYEDILESLKSSGFNISDTPLKISKLRKIWLALRAIRESKRPGKKYETEERTTVIGAGVAGISAALKLAENGFDVSLYESRNDVGGRASSIKWKSVPLDNGTHALMGCYGNFFGILDMLHTGGNEFYKPVSAMDFLFPDKTSFTADYSRKSLLQRALRFLGYRKLRGFSALSNLLLLLKIKMGLAGAFEGETAGEYLRRNGVNTQAIENFWTPFCISALNPPLEKADAALMRTTLKKSVLRGGNSGILYIPQKPIAESLKPALLFIEAVGGKCHLGESVKELLPRGEKIEGARTDKRDICDCGNIISAVPPKSLFALLPRDSRLNAILPNLKHSEILNVYFTTKSELTKLDYACFPGSKIHWIFNYTARYRKYSGEGGFMYGVTISANDGILDNDKISGILEQELSKYFGAFKIEDALPLHFKDATILADSETCLLRPSSAAAPFGNVTLVGDWISTGLPATIESAAMSAHIDISR